MGDTLTTKATVFGLNMRGGYDSLDNGIGFMGANTRDPGLVGVSLPIEAFKDLYGGITAGKNIIREQGSPLIEVTNPKTGQTIQAPLVDLGPSQSQQSKGVGLDLTYGAAQALGATGLDPMQYKVISAPGATGTIDPGEFGTFGNQEESTIIASTDTAPALSQPFTPVTQVKEVGTGGVNPATGELVKGGQTGPLQQKQARGFNPLESASSLFTGISESKGGSTVGNLIAQAIPTLLGPLTQGIAGRDQTSSLGKVGGSIRNFFEGDIGTGNTNSAWPTISESIASIFGTSSKSSLAARPDDSKVSTGTSSANGRIQGGFSNIANFFGGNASSNSTGPVGAANVDTSRKG